MHKVFLFAILWFSYNASLVAQYSFEGPWQAGSYRGSAVFGFAIDKQDSVYNGDFVMSGAQLVSTSLDQETYFKFSGQFDQGLATDQWEITFGAFRQAGPIQVKDYAYRVPLTGTEKVARGTLVDGKPSGIWIHQEEQIAADQLARTVFTSDFNFANGIPRKSFKISGPASKLLGRWQRGGVATDVWTYFGDDGTTQRWTFENGALSSILDESEIDSASIEDLLPKTKAVSVLPLGKTYFRWLANYLFSLGQDSSLASGPFADLLIQNAKAFAKTDQVFKALGHQGFMPKLEVTVPLTIISEGEKTELAQLTAEVQAIDSTAQVLLNDTSLKLVSKTDDRTRRQLAYLKALTTDFIAPVRPLIRAKDEGVLQHLPREKYYIALFNNVETSGEVDYTYEQSGIPQVIVGGDSTLSFDVSRNGLRAIIQRVRFAKAEVKAAERLLLRQVNTKEKQKVIEALEAELDASYSQLDSLILAQDRRLVRQLGLKNISEGAKAELTAYAALDQVLAKRKRAEALIRCMQLKKALVVTLTELPQRVEEIERLYTDRIWNNFTFTVMDELVKDELVDAYTARLIPYFNSQLSEPLTCADTELLLNAIEDSHDKLVGFRKANTKELEVALSRTSDPEKILSLITSFAL